SLSEGLSNALMEAMASGVPVVATGVGGTNELIADGKSGLLVTPGQSDQLAEAMLKVLSNKLLQTQLTKAAREKIGQLSMDNMVRKTEALYERLLDEWISSSSL